MLVTSMPLHRVVDDSGEEVEVNMLVEMISAPIEQREELSAEQDLPEDEAGLGDRDPITLVLTKRFFQDHQTITSCDLYSAKIWKLLLF